MRMTASEAIESLELIKRCNQLFIAIKTTLVTFITQKIIILSDNILTSEMLL